MPMTEPNSVERRSKEHAASVVGLASALLLLVAATGCHRHRLANEARIEVQQGGQQQVVEQQAPAADTRTLGQVWVDGLAQGGYQCVASDTFWTCNPPNDGWTFLVSFNANDQGGILYIESFLTRAFGKPCAKYTNHMADLGSPGDNFEATCDDGSQQFRLRTTLNNSQGGLDINAWTQNHLAKRVNAQQLLRGAHALRE